MDTQLQERVDKLEAELEALRDMTVTLSRWNQARTEEIADVKTKLEITTTGYDAWSIKVDNTLQKVMDKIEELEASRPWINTYDDQFNKRQALYSPEMYIVLEMVEKAATVQEWYAVREALNNVLRKIRQGKNNPSGNAHRREDGSNA